MPQPMRPRPGAGGLAVEIDITEGSRLRLRNAAGQFAKEDKALRAQAIISERIILYELADAIRRNFAIHDKTGATMASMRVETIGSLGRITIGGAAELIETGADPHDITPANGGIMRFEGTEGDIAFARSVQHPGFAPDRFIERAMEETSVEFRLSQIATMASKTLKFYPLESEIP